MTIFKQQSFIKPVLIYIMVALTCLVSPMTQAEKSPPVELDDVLSVQTNNLQQSIDSQKRIDQLDEQSLQALREYRTTTREAESIEIYNRQLAKLIDSQQSGMRSLNQQLAELNTTEREVVPLMLRMLDTLEKFIALDMPFLLEERRQRVQQLRVLMNNADASLAEKYRRIMEAYLIETDYGNSTEAYRAKLDKEDSPTVEFLRIGRLALFYRSLDGTKLGVWNKQDKAWQTLDSSYDASIDQGIRIARKQAAPQILELPVQTVKHD
jgi:hypothetical protein